MEPKDSQFEPTLCFPDSEKSCFACCPPIRPQGYEHIQYRREIERMLRENTSAFASSGKGVFPITGFSCWALGYVDGGYRLVGCLLHPFQNKGVDLRFRIGYGEKCRRESCPESKIFLELDGDVRRFWLQLCDGLDSFSYSSQKTNPLFKMLGWGPRILHLIALNEQGRFLTKESFFRVYAFFTTRFNSRSGSYLLNQLISDNNVDVLKMKTFREKFEHFSCRLSEQLSHVARHEPDASYTHLLNVDHCFLDFLRLSVGLQRIEEAEALRLKEKVDKSLEEFAANGFV